MQISFRTNIPITKYFKVPAAVMALSVEPIIMDQ